MKQTGARVRGAVAVMTSLSMAASMSGCSFIFSEGPPPRHEQLPYFDCSSSYAPPVLDTIWGGLNGLGALAAAGQSDQEWRQNNSTSRSSVVAVGLIWLFVSGASAIYGYRKVSECREAKSELMSRQMRGPGPQAWPPPGYPSPYGPPTGYPPGGYGYPPGTPGGYGYPPGTPPPPSTTPPPPPSPAPATPKTAPAPSPS